MLFLDTHVVIGLLRGRKPAVRERYNAARSAGAAMALSAVALFELRSGVALSERPTESERALSVFLSDAIAIAPFDEAAAKEAGLIRAALRRAGEQIGPYDMLIAAQVRAANATLVTANTREFARVPGLRLVDWSA